MKYVKIFSFEAMDEVIEGKEVFMLDRERCEVYSVNELSVSELAEILETKDTTGRFVFWYKEREGENG